MNLADIVIGASIAGAVILVCVRAYRRRKRGETG